ncbi:hypothetical protein CEXT_628081 [Caerostris extrusa]|uniref:Uncharacterized protein n=1 Tax=Caerostris extrusa TaxID=172846 RepID=A0AAV4UPR0_CAEEX|nr:hypothetical protein CEXT_628081 [Caerostris extrusa]
MSCSGAKVLMVNSKALGRSRFRRGSLSIWGGGTGRGNIDQALLSLHHYPKPRPARKKGGRGIPTHENFLPSIWTPERPVCDGEPEGGWSVATHARSTWEKRDIKAIRCVKEKKRLYIRTLGMSYQNPFSIRIKIRSGHLSKYYIVLNY